MIKACKKQLGAYGLPIDFITNYYAINLRQQYENAIAKIVHSDYSTKNYAPKWHKMLDGITIKQLYYALKRESWYSTTHEKTLTCPICRSQLSLEDPCEHVKAQIKNTGDEYDTRWLKENRLERNRNRIVPKRTTKHRYGAPTEEDSTYETKKQCWALVKAREHVKEWAEKNTKKPVFKIERRKSEAKGSGQTS